MLYDPVRYGSLLHPGEQFAYDIFAQAAESVLDPAVLGALAAKVDRRLAAGASQSAIKLTDYVNDWHADDRVFDGFLPQLNAPDGIRHDLVPVLFLNSQNELRDAEPVPDSEPIRAVGDGRPFARTRSATASTRTLGTSFTPPTALSTCTTTRLRWPGATRTTRVSAPRRTPSMPDISTALPWSRWTVGC